MDKPLIIAIAKGRVLTDTLPLLAAIDITPLEDVTKSRKLVIPTSDPSVHLMIVRSADVLTYVTYGAAAFGVVGKDMLCENSPTAVYEVCDLGVSRCRLMVIGKEGTELGDIRRPAVATKYIACTRHFFAERKEQPTIIKLYGSMELAPLVGLSDYIVDLVATGRTIAENGLQPLALIVDSTARLVVHETTYRVRHRQVTTLISRMQAVVAQH